MLKTLSMESLGETVLAGQFAEAMSAIQESFEKDKDIAGARTITIKMSFIPDDRGHIKVDMDCTYNTPSRKVKTIAILESGTLKIDTLSNDARQPDLYDNHSEGGK